MRLPIVALILTLAGTAAAEPTDAEKDAARILFTEGKELRDAGKLAPALERFTRAHQLAATPITTVELARTHVMLGHLLEARRLYQSVDAMEKKVGESAKSLSARDEAKHLASETDKRIATIVVRLVPADEKITSAAIDGKSIDLAALGAPIEIDPGKHVITVRTTTEVSVTISAAEADRDRIVTIDLPKPAPPPLVAPIVPRPLSPERPATSGTPSTLRWIGLVSGGVGLVVGVGAGALALSSASDVKSGCPGSICGPSHHDDLDATRRWATVSTIGFGVAAVGATLFVIGLTSESSKKDVARTILPYASVTPMGGGFGLTGRF